MTRFDDLGPNSGLVEELYQRYLQNPQSVDPHWRAYFDGQAPPPNGAPTTTARPAVRLGAAPAPAPSGAPPAGPPAAPAPAAVGRPGPIVLEGDESEPLRGAAARTVENMEASLAVPTATSVRVVPAKLLEVNRQILNNQLGRTGSGKVSFTHLIAYAVVRAVAEFPNLNSSYATQDGKPVVVRHEHVNLGLAVDVKRRDGAHSLLVPNVKEADALDFAGFWRKYEDLIDKVRGGKISPDDFAGTTCTITNPGMIGTVHSVPRLMPGQGFIVGVGSIGYPAEFEGADPAALAQLGVSKTTTLTNTYDHRIISGAESGEFLRFIHELLLGHNGFYDDVFASLAVPYEPARWNPDRSAFADPATQNEKVVQVHGLINMYRVRGHLIANLDPLGRRLPTTHPELDISHHDLSIWDLERDFPIGNLGAGRLPRKVMPLREILGVLRDAYSRTIGVEYMHIQEPDQKEWIQRRVEGPPEPVTTEEKHRILERLNSAEAFERFLHTKYLGQKRFSLEGAETLVPMLDSLCSQAADTGMDNVVLGASHRGRLNVLANVIGKSYAQIFREFEGELDPSSTQGSGDVKYHLGAVGKHDSPKGNHVALTLAANPSHLEAVGPVVEGMARAVGDQAGDEERRTVLPVLLHGDAAFAGQGVVAETFNLSEVPGYEVGGTVHVVVNNQLGFTTAPDLGRSSVYPTDVAKMVQAPIFHVNGDDPEAAVRVIAPRVRVPRSVQEGRGRRSRLLPALRPQRVRRARLHAAEDVRAHPGSPVGARALHPAAPPAGRPRPRRRAGRRVRLQGAPRAGLRGDPRQPRERRHRRRRHRGRRRRRPRPVAARRHRHHRRDRGPGRRRAHPLAGRLHREPQARTPAARPAHDGGEGRDRLGAGRGTGLRIARARRHHRAPGRPGHAPGHVQPASRGAGRPGDRGGVHPARAPLRRPGAVHAVRHRAVGVRRPRLRVRLLDLVGCARLLGSPVR